VSWDLPNDTIELRGLRGHGHHGVYEEERRTGQLFLVDVTLWLDLSDAGRSDDVSDTVHYGELAAAVVAVVEGEPVQLIETLAERVAATCLDRDRVDRVRVTVHKPEAPIEVTFADVAVTIERGR
jgi:dihydroneopterin aldolase